MGSITKAVYNAGLALWWGGTAMGTLAMNPAVEVLDDPEERGKMVDEGWARFQPYAAAGLTAAIISHIILRRKGPRPAPCDYKAIAVLKDLLVVTAVVSSVASLALGEYAVQDFDTYASAEGSSESSGEGGDRAPQASKSLTIASMVQLLSGAGLFLTGAILESKRHRLTKRHC